ncbi:SAV_2336 N-terminal domain-related protein [Streptomyces sp. NPDC086554]|uniref:SAV_2336 N-terminal domain-related protein n=1 Tax=Streptomyces sp. NPDC086554 TaxID=3154864 RepID=UPI0034398930
MDRRDDSRRDDSLGAALQVLKAAGQDLDAQEVLDVLWLAKRLADGPEELPLARAGRHGQGRPDVSAAEPAPPGEDDGDAPEPGTPDADLPDLTTPELHAASLPPLIPDRPVPLPPDDEQPALPLRVPEDKALRQELLIGRALRPLKRKRPSRWRQELDEAATAAALAETRLPDVVMRPARERWLHLALVVDGGLSMLLWHRLAADLRTALQRLAAFRSIRVLGLDTRGPDAPVLHGRPFETGASTMSPTVLLDPTGQTLVLVVSDGLGSAWRRGTMHDVLLGLATSGPVAVLHTLPPALWDGSGIQADRWQATTRRPGGANTSWEITDRVLPAGVADFSGVPIPVLEPAADSLRDWSLLLTSPGTTVELPLLARPQRHAPITPGREVRGIQHFRDAASPEAYRLAAHLAAVSPLSVPVMRLVQSAVPWRAPVAQLAEVFLGGLMHPFPAPVPGPLPAKHRIFDFTEESKTALLDAVPSSELMRTGRAIGRRLEQLAGRSPDFPVWLTHPEGADTVPAAFHSFTAVERRLLARFGVAMQPRVPAFDAPTRARAEPWSPLTPQDPQRLGPYRLLGRRAGTRTLVYLGRNDGGAEAALRVARPELPVATEQLLITEAEALRRMNGRYAPELLASGLEGRPPWLAMRLLSAPGNTDLQPPRLNELLAYETPEGTAAFDILTSLLLAWHLASAVSICHLNSLVPAGLSPDSVIVLERSVVLVGLSDCVVDGEYSGAGAAPTREDNIRSLGELLRLISSKRQASLPGLPDGMHLWQGTTWEPLRDMVKQCLDPDPRRRPTAGSVADQLARYVAIAQAMRGDRQPSSGQVPASPGRPAERPLLAARPDGGGTPTPSRIGRRSLRIDLGLGGARAARERRLELVRRPLTYNRRITVVGAHPSCGRSTTTFMLGSLFVAVRGEPVLAMDGAPASGDLNDYLVHQKAATPRDLTRLPLDAGYADIRRLTSLAPTGLEILAHRASYATRSPAYAEEYRRILTMTARHYPVTLTDWAAPTRDPALDVALDTADRLIICCTTSTFSVAAATELLADLRVRGRQEAASRAVIVASRLGGIDKPLQDSEIEDRFAADCAGTVLVPFDLHLSEHRAKELGRLRARTAEAFLDLAARVVVDPREAGA